MAKATENDESPLQFPTDFPIKIMGKATEQFEEMAIALVLRTFPTTNLNTISKRLSKDQNYLAITVVVHAKSRAELDKLYQDLTAAPEVLMVL